jgi:hypothetical protein
MRHGWLVAVLVACGGSAQTPVVELSDESQKNLCQHFVDEVCTNPGFAPFCADPCHTSSCNVAVTSRFVQTRCDRDADGDVITAEDVDACATTGTAAACTAGGCMFDALIDACGGT